ncbi:MAG: ABC transporter permease [Vicinamibacterales bacterium]
MKLVHDLIAFWHRAAAFVRRRRIARDIDEELAFHLSMRQHEHEAGGLPADEAARRARVRFGNPVTLAEETRDMWTFPSFDQLRQDARFALRSLRKTPAFTLVAVAVLALGIGANTAVYSLVDAMFVRGLPYPRADRLVLLIGNVQRQEVERRGGSYPDYLDWKAQATTVDAMAAFDSTTITVAGGTEDPDRLVAEPVSAGYFEILGVRPALGRTFRADEDEVAGRNPVVILGHGLWSRRFGADPGIIGRSLQVGGRAVDVVGVMPAGFTGLTDQADLWVPFVNASAAIDRRGTRWFNAIGRLRDGVTVAQAQAEFDGIAAGLERQYPDTNEKRGVEVASLRTETFGAIQPAVVALMAAVGFVLLIACANVANLLISRSESRQREMAVRTALGAGRARLFRQLVTESAVLALLGAAAGLGVAQLALRLLVALPDGAVPTFVQPTLDLRVLAFTMAVALGCGLVLGLAPSFHARATAVSGILKDSVRGSSGGRAQRLRAGLVVTEVALAVVLLIGAGLMIRTVQNLTAIDPGYDATNVLTFNVAVPRLETPPPAASASPGAPPAAPAYAVSATALLDRLRAVPGVVAVSLSTDLPLQGASAVFYSAEGDTTSDAETRPRAYIHRITPDFFDVLGVPIVAGRTFEPADLTGPIPVVVSEGVPRRFWPGQDPIGRHLQIGSTALTIIGVVPDLKYRGLPDNPTADPDLYVPYAERGVQSIALRTAVSPLSIVPSVRGALREANPDIVVFGVSALEDLVLAQTAQSRFTTWLMGVFAGVAVLLAVIGIYGVLSYIVSQRAREFGIRMALGAGRREILAVVGRFGAKLVGLGLVLGGVASIGLGRLLEQLLFGVSTASASGAGAVAIALLAVVAMAACLIPAWRATRVDPMVALRND